MKPKLVCVDETFLNGASGHHLPLFGQYFDITNFDEGEKYEPGTTFMYRNDRSRSKLEKYEHSCKFIADGVWEMNFFCNHNFTDNTLGLINNGFVGHSNVLAIPKWFWFEEHFSQQDKRKLIKDLPFTHPKTRSFLMQMGDAKVPRIKLYERLKNKNLLDNAVYSFLEYGIGLEGPVRNYDPLTPPFPQRAYRPEWYNTSHFTLVAECFQSGIDLSEDSVSITEKTMKPIMYGHPFILLGDTHSLRILSSWGFNTFPELFDESYDEVSNIDQRIEMIVNEVANHKHQSVDDKIVYNFQRFWDTRLVESMMVEEMIQPILEFISKK